MNHYTAGVLCGFAAVLIFFFLIMLVIKKKMGGDGLFSKFDERQMAGRGKAFTLGYFTLLVGEIIVSLGEMARILPGSGYLWHLGVIMLGILIFALAAIHYDGYLGMMENPRRFAVMGGAIMLCMLASAAMNLMSDRKSNHEIGYVNLMLAVVWVFILLALFLHNHSKKAEDEE